MIETNRKGKMIIKLTWLIRVSDRCIDMKSSKRPAWSMTGFRSSSPSPPLTSGPKSPAPALSKGTREAQLGTKIESPAWTPENAKYPTSSSRCSVTNPIGAVVLAMLHSRHDSLTNGVDATNVATISLVSNLGKKKKKIVIIIIG